MQLELLHLIHFVFFILLQVAGWNSDTILGDLCSPKKKTLTYISLSFFSKCFRLSGEYKNEIRKSETDFQLGHCLHAQLNRDNWTFIFVSLNAFLTGLSQGSPLEGKSPSLIHSVYSWYSHMTYKSAAAAGRREGTENEGLGIQQSQNVHFILTLLYKTSCFFS